MYNPAVQPRNKLNSFTNVIALAQALNRKTQVRLRNGVTVFPTFKAAEDETCLDAFYTEDYEFCWNLDGSSVTRPDYDMLELIYLDKNTE